MSTEPKIAVVAGGSAGVGRAVVSAMLDRGWRVAVLARGQARLDEIEAEHGERVMTQACDVSKDDEVARAADAVVARWGAEPWRMATADYRAAASVARKPLTGSPVLASWDDGLAPALEEVGLAVHEEQVVADLLEDLSAAAGHR